ncbi:hypothetical protein OFN48_36130, partial [Escherichia coli]|nr:hypothetical protein [Escherichia coli]
MAQSSKTSRMTIPDLMSSQRDGAEGTADVCIMLCGLIYGCFCVAEITSIHLFETDSHVENQPLLTYSLIKMR